MRQNRGMTKPSEPPARRPLAQHRPVARVAAALACALSLLASPAADSRERTPPARWTAELEAEAAQLEAALAKAPPANAGELRVRLAFGAAADLDLYVTDPLDETIYFANERAAAGGRLVADARCDSASPRIEEIVFAAPKPGRYRIGVDYMVWREACGEQPAVVAYVLAIDGPAGPRRERGLARRGLFDARRLELEVSR
jgi:hypothetical protein